MLDRLPDEDEDAGEPDTQNDADRMLGLLDTESSDLPKQQDVADFDLN